MPDLIRCIAWLPNGNKKIRMFPDDRWGVQDAVDWEWKMLDDGATKIEYFKAGQNHGMLERKGVFYSSNWVPFDLKEKISENSEKDDESKRPEGEE